MAQSHQDAVIELRDCDFDWGGPADDFALRGVELVVRRGELVGVAGRVASGKSYRAITT